ncbi:MAG: hypothetical protein ACD_28C00133G0002 [uncultured bacterium]|nr:MAG: hypothetical protein ACD_28C00133G0002 [uncultured bacterium]KKT75288.1 MAG: Phenylalanine-tRNA ligase beta subunit [Candidatus Peregrinibacteria bacterium GW2011_GWA2_44_7]
MKISLTWLQEFVDFKIIDKASLDHVVVGYVESVQKHPEADTLNVARVNIGENTVSIVCGGINLTEKIHVPVALPGAILPGNFKIQKSKIRGAESAGMICAKEELGLGENPARKIWILENNKKWEAGEPLLKALELEKAHSPKELSEWITEHTAEVEGVEATEEPLQHVVTGKLIEFEKIAGSEKLHRGEFDVGWKKVQIVFGSVYKLERGEILPLALAGAKLPGGEIKMTELAGVKSEGMVCGDSEMGIQNSIEGLTRFPQNTPLGKPIADVLHLKDIVLEIDNKSLTHRPDLWGHYGMARELAAILKKPLKPLDSLLTFKATDPSETLTLELKAPSISKRFSACIMTGLTIEESPQWLKGKLQTIGMRPINNIVDITNFVMAELGQPMHAYDRKKVGTDQLKIRYADDGEKLETLDRKERSLRKEDGVVATDKEALGLAGVMGGARSEINNDTTEIILEAAHWDPIVIRKSSSHHGLRSEASQRFEKSLDPALTEVAIKRALHLIQQICPSAKVISAITTVGDWKPSQKSIHVNPASVVSKIGIPISIQEMETNLSALGFNVKKSGTGNSSTLSVEVPSHRATGDVNIEEDIVEEVARLYGYNNIPTQLPELPVRLPIENTERTHKHEARKIWAKTLGFTEISNYSFYNEETFKKAGLEDVRHIRVKNPLSAEQTHMRTTLIPSLLEKIRLNQRQKDQISLFEIGRSYKEIGEFMPWEEKWIAGLCSQKTKGEIFYHAKGAVAQFLEEFRAGPILWKPSSAPSPYAHPKKSMEIHIKGKKIGEVFGLHPEIIRKFEVEHHVAGFEINFTELAKLGRENHHFKSIPKFPSIFFDISFLIDRKTESGEVMKVMLKADRLRLMRNIELFDVYEGKNIPDNKKSLAYRIELRHNERTLNDKEFKETQQALFEAIQKSGGEVRS